jgi:hypothetical protein
MSFAPVTAYEADWNPKQNVYRITVWVGSDSAAVPIDNPTEFLAVLLMLDKPGVVVDSPSGDIRVPHRSPGA